MQIWGRGGRRRQNLMSSERSLQSELMKMVVKKKKTKTMKKKKKMMMMKMKMKMKMKKKRLYLCNHR